MQVLYMLGIDLDIPWWLLLIVGLLAAYYKYMTWHFGVFKKLGIPGPKPIPILGNLRYYFKLGFRSADQKILEECGSYAGIFFGRAPEILTDDVSFLKQVLVKEFNNFVDRNKLEFADKPINRGLTALQGEEWRIVRNTLTPTFSAGKMKKMNGKINGCVDQFVENIQESSDQDKSFDLLALAGNYTMDVIARTAFGLEINCQKEKNHAFLTHVQKTMQGSLKSPFFILMLFFPFAMKFVTGLGIIRAIPKATNHFFSSIAEQTLNMKKSKTGTKDQDFMQLMADAHNEETKDEDVEKENIDNMQQDKHKKKTLSIDDILGNAMLFFIAGYETTANTLAFAGYYLATNPEVQDKLIEEIDRVVGDKKPTYDILHEMNYLDNVFSETLRLQPQAPKLTRHCEKDITINGMFIPAGMQIGIPVMALHMNPDIWPEPEKFIPDRFTPEEKANRDPYYYQPFGIGPRACIGMRLAQMEMKMAVIGILQKFKLVTCSETEIPLKLHELRPKPANGVFLKAEKRQK